MNNFWFKIKHPILALAPMAGITDSAFRQICRRYGADVVYSEMASVSALYFHPVKYFSFTKNNFVDQNLLNRVKPQKTLELVKFEKAERPYIVQLFGKDPAHFAKATKIISEKVKPDGIDINFGCPAKKVFGHGSGCALMMQKELAREIISAVCENTNLPVSIKIRAGVKDATALEFVRYTADLPYSAIMIHGRTYEGGFSGPLDFKLVEKIKKMFPEKIVLANGGINSAEDGVKILKDHPLLDGLGIARGAWGRPWIFEEIKDLLSCAETRHCLVSTTANYDFKKIHLVKYFSITKNNFAEQNLLNRVKKIMLLHAKLIHKDKGQHGLFEIRKHMSWYVKGFPGASELRRKLVLAESVEEIKEILNQNH
ncbi:MAG: tRNA-dihydrouridine synthase [Candidatus Moraniibacteriota bacterium]